MSTTPPASPNVCNARREQLAQLNDSVLTEQPRFEQRWLEHGRRLRDKISSWI